MKICEHEAKYRTETNSKDRSKNDARESGQRQPDSVLHHIELAKHHDHVQKHHEESREEKFVIVKNVIIDNVIKTSANYAWENFKIHDKQNI